MERLIRGCVQYGQISHHPDYDHLVSGRWDSPIIKKHSVEDSSMETYLVLHDHMMENENTPFNDNVYIISGKRFYAKVISLDVSIETNSVIFKVFYMDLEDCK